MLSFEVGSILEKVRHIATHLSEFNANNFRGILDLKLSNDYSLEIIKQKNSNFQVKEIHYMTI